MYINRKYTVYPFDLDRDLTLSKCVSSTSSSNEVSLYLPFDIEVTRAYNLSITISTYRLSTSFII